MNPVNTTNDKLFKFSISFKDMDDEIIKMSKYGLPINFSSTKKEHKNHSKKKKIHFFKKLRYELFSKFDKGIKIDKDSYYLVTPEVVAIEIAKYCLKKINFAILIDGFCGCGGNIIQFAKNNPNSIIIAIDINQNRVLNALNNAKIYGVENQIEFIIGDYMLLAKTCNFKADIVFLSPPWGGLNYKIHKKFLFDLMPINGKDIYLLTKKYITNNIAYYLPKNFDLTDYKEFGEKIKVVKNLLNKNLSTYVIYSGELALNDEK